MPDGSKVRVAHPTLLIQFERKRSFNGERNAKNEDQKRRQKALQTDEVR